MSLNPFAYFAKDVASDQIVPPKGNTAWLMGLAAAAMSFIAVLALMFSLAIGHMADLWSRTLAHTATVQIKADAPQGQTPAALALLRATPGIISANIITRETALQLSPWPSPPPADARLIHVQLKATPPDAEKINQQLQAQAPGAVYMRHTLSRGPVSQLQFMADIILGLTAAITAIIIVLTATTAMASNREIIKTLRLLGAQDAYIAKAFVRRITLRATLGAMLGMVAAILAIALIPAPSQEGGAMAGFSLSLADWIYPLFVPLLVAATAALAAHLAARRHLLNLS